LRWVDTGKVKCYNLDMNIIDKIYYKCFNGSELYKFINDAQGAWTNNSWLACVGIRKEIRRGEKEDQIMAATLRRSSLLSLLLRRLTSLVDNSRIVKRVLDND